MTTPNVTRNTLFEILSFARPHDGSCEKRFVKEFIDKAHPDVMQDAFGNRILRIGSAPILWSCHVDTVGTHDGHQLVDFDPQTGIARLFNGKPGQSLGADNGAGVWMLLAMIEAGVQGLYVFHRGEEKGCLGSRWIADNAPELLKGIDAAIAFDRAGTADVITHQAFGMTASDEFAQSLADQLNRTKGFKFRPDDTGVYTDTNEYAGMIAECSNVSVGYDCNHGPNETLDVYHVEKLLAAVLDLDLDALVIKRQPGDGGWGDYYAGAYEASMRSGSLGTTRNARLSDLIEAVTHCPEAAAKLLYANGMEACDVWDMALDCPHEDELDGAYGRAWYRDDEEDAAPFDVDQRDEENAAMTKEQEHDAA
jgi:hypothetical protein